MRLEPGSDNHSVVASDVCSIRLLSQLWYRQMDRRVIGTVSFPQQTVAADPAASILPGFGCFHIVLRDGGASVDSKDILHTADHLRKKLVNS
jgi:hypothetical protein